MDSGTETRAAASQDSTAAGGGAQAACLAAANGFCATCKIAGSATVAFRRIGTRVLAVLGRMADMTASAVGMAFDRKTRGTCVSAGDRAKPSKGNGSGRGT